VQYQRPQDLIVTFEDDGSVLLRSTSRGAGARAPAWAVGVLAGCGEPRTREEVAQVMGPQAASAFDGLVDAGLLVPPEEADQTPVIFHNYTGIEVHRVMLADEARLVAYREGIRAVVKPGDVVIDAGSGSGVLAVMAALAGARKVYAIERSDFGAVIPRIAADSGVGDRVQLVRGDISRVELPEKADVIVTETFGHWSIAEGLMPDVLACAAHNLKPGGRIVPGSFTLWFAPMAACPDVPGPMVKRPDGVDLRALVGDSRGRAPDRLVLPSEIGAPICMGTISMPCDGDFEGTLVLDQDCAALCGWFDLHMTGTPGEVDLSTGPHAPPTHWKQTVFPVALKAGTHAVSASVAPEDHRTLVVSIGGQEVRIR
jgi:SAM-dependent methyltransferase